MKNGTNKKPTFGEVVQLAANCFVIKGKENHPLRGATSSSVLLYKQGSTVSLIDSGAGILMKEKIFLTAKNLQPYTRLLLYTTQASPEHATNSSIIESIDAEKKGHYLTHSALAELQTLTRLKSEALRDLSHYTELYESCDDILETIFKQYEQLKPEVLLAHALDENAKKTLRYGTLTLHGWQEEASGITFIETEGSGPGSAMIYIEELKLLYTGGEAAHFFSPWSMNHLSKQRSAFNAIQKMIEGKYVEKLVGSLPEQIFLNRADSLSFIEEIIDTANRFDMYIRKNLIGHSREGGATIDQLYNSLKAGPFGQFLPEWDIEAKIIILHKLRSLGCMYRPEQGPSAHFLLPDEK